MTQEKFKTLLQTLIHEANNEEINSVEEIIEKIVLEVELTLAPSYT